MNIVVKERNGCIDIIKGLSIFSVVLGHLLSADIVLVKVIYLFHMPCFFFISGYLSYSSIKKAKSYKRILISKVRRLLFPYIVWSGAAYFFNLILLLITDKNLFNLKSIGKEAWEIFVEARSVWFLIILFSTFMFMEIVQYIESKMTCKYTSWIYVVGWILLCIVLPDSIFRLYKLKYFFPFFVLGFLIHRNVELFPLDKFKKLLRINFIMFLAAIFLLRKNDALELFYTLNINGLTIVQIMIAIILSLMGIGFLFFMAFLLNETKLGTTIEVWGIYSLDIYVIHMLFVKILYKMTHSLYLSSIFSNYILNPITAIAVLFLIVFFVKKIKLKAYYMITGK